MSVSDEQLELFEAYIDGELPEVDADALRRRLLADPSLAMVIEELRAERSVRAGIFESCEPNDATVEQLLSRVQKQITKDIIWGERLRIVRYISAAAACVIISFFAGWVGRSRSGPFGVGNGRAEAPMVQATNSGSGGPFDFPTNPGVGTLISNVQPPPAASRRPAGSAAENTGGYEVALTDTLGHVVAVQHFDTLEEAREFSEDVTRSQKQQQQIHGADTVLIKDQF